MIELRARILLAATTPLVVAIATGAPQAELTYETRSFVRSSGTCRAADETGPCTSVAFTWPEITTAGSVEVAAAINGPIREWLRRPVFEDNGGTPEEIADGLQLTHDQFREEFPEFAQRWWVERTVSVVRDTPGVFALSMYEEMFTGGAHGIHTLLYRNQRPDTGAPIALDDLLVAGGRAQLTTIAEGIFREQMEVPADAPLSEAGFWFDDDRFALNDNFLIDADGLLFHYNEYEIAAYAFGPTDLRVPYQAIGQLLRPGAPR